LGFRVGFPALVTGHEHFDCEWFLLRVLCFVSGDSAVRGFTQDMVRGFPSAEEHAEGGGDLGGCHCGTSPKILVTSVAGIIAVPYPVMALILPLATWR
jgi:hypothetical protein